MEARREQARRSRPIADANPTAGARSPMVPTASSMGGGLRCRTAAARLEHRSSAGRFTTREGFQWPVAPAGGPRVRGGDGDGLACDARALSSPHALPHLVGLNFGTTDRPTGSFRKSTT